ncbi:competence protein CoiA family protein [Streptomyces sp900105755]|uniref:Competence protein CoiA family protein n=1 Tax=Streptomyces sp. 900105755 TaxID=3154389 RepID=A0ABV1TLC7_9ACTN
MTYADSRLVQTAVIGSRGSDRAIILPTDADELARWRRHHPDYSYWCGTLLGGCGNELSDRLYRDKVCHFAHHPHTSCHRTATGASSADHLFVKGDLTAWAGRRRLKASASLRNLGTGPGDAVDFRVREARQHVRFQFRKLAHAEWTEASGRLIRESATVDWVFGPGAAHPATMEELYDVHGYLLRFRCETQGAARRVRLRAEHPRRSTDWVPLDACLMTPDGLRLPGMRGPGRHIRPAVSVPEAPAPAPKPQSRAERVAAVRQALVSAARLRTRPTWGSLSRAAGLDLTAITDAERVRLLVEVDEGVGREGRPLLSALLRSDEGGTPVYLGQVSRAVGCGSPATAAVLKRWCQREVDRAFAVHGIPPRTPPPRLEIDRDGHIAADSAPPHQPRVIVHSAGGAPQEWDRLTRELHRAEELRRDLVMARNDKAVRLVAALLKEGEEVLPRLARAQGSKLRSEMVSARNWLRGRLERGETRSTAGKRAAEAPKSGKRKRRKRRKGSANGARPLPGSGQ